MQKAVKNLEEKFSHTIDYFNLMVRMDCVCEGKLRIRKRNRCPSKLLSNFPTGGKLSADHERVCILEGFSHDHSRDDHQFCGEEVAPSPVLNSV